MGKTWDGICDAATIITGLPVAIIGTVVTVPVLILTTIAMCADPTLREYERKRREGAMKYDGKRWEVEYNREEIGGVRHIYLYEVGKKYRSAICDNISSENRYYRRWSQLREGDILTTRVTKRPNQQMINFYGHGSTEFLEPILES